MKMFQIPKLNPIQLSFFGLPLVLLTGGCNKSASKAAIQISPKLEAIRQAGGPVTLAELSESYVEPPAAEKPLSLLPEAFRAMAPLQPAAPAFLSQNQKAIEILHQAVSRQKCRYPIDLTKGACAALPHLMSFKKRAHLPAAAAASRAAQGKMELAAQSLLDGLLLARSLQEEPLVLSRVHQIATVNIIQRGLEPVLNRKPFSEEQLGRLQAGFAEAENGASLARPLAGERCIGIAVFQSSTQEQVEMFAKAQKMTGKFDVEAYRKRAAFAADFISYLDLMDKSIALSALPYDKSLDAIGAWNAERGEAKSKGYQFSELLVPALDTVLERVAQCSARLRLAQTALAVERYHQANRNARPDSLAHLVAQFLPEVAFEPFDSQPLRYKKLPSVGFVIEGGGKDGNEEVVAPELGGGKGDDG